MLLILTLPVYVQAQDSTMNMQRYTTVKLGMGPSPAGYHPFTILPATEIRTDKYGIQLQVGMMIPRYYSLQDTLDYLLLQGHEQWYTIRAEIRKYKTLRNNFIPGKREVYVGIELFANYYKTPRHDEYYSHKFNVVYEDVFLLTKKMIGAGIVIGKQRIIGKHLLIALHTGLGIKFRYNTTEHSKHPDGRTTYIHGMFMSYADQPGFTIAAAVPINFSIGYVFR